MRAKQTKNNRMTVESSKPMLGLKNGVSTIVNAWKTCMEINIDSETISG